MTKPQIWVSAFLVLFILLFVLGRLTKEKKVERDFSNQLGNTEIEQNTAEQLINNFGCINCHGNNLTGTQMGPPLVKLSEYWSKESLITYLRNPMAYMDEDRFIEYRKKYPSQIMPGYGEKNIKDLGKIAEYLLAL